MSNCRCAVCDAIGDDEHAEYCPGSRHADLERQLAGREWQGMDSAPRDGTEILGWRGDCGTMVIRWTSCDAFMTDQEMDESCMDEDDLFAQDWFYADFIAGGRLEGSEAPTKWMPLPTPPEGT